MPVYVVSYEQSRESESAALHEALRNLGGECILSGLFVVDSPGDAEGLHRHLSEFLQNEDRIFVTRLTEDFSGYVLQDAGRWLDTHKPL